MPKRWDAVEVTGVDQDSDRVMPGPVVATTGNARATLQDDVSGRAVGRASDRILRSRQSRALVTITRTNRRGCRRKLTAS